MSQMRIILFRHAEKAASQFAPNPPLSPKGFVQAEDLWKRIELQKLPSPRKVLVSPLLRAHQTAAITAANLSLPLQSTNELLERQDGESIVQFRSRIEKFLKWLGYQQSQDGPIFLVTHFDWIEEAMTLIHCSTDLAQEQYSCWSSGQYMQFHIQDQMWILEKQGRLEAQIKSR
jgi:broad specificity phosphatase PhoE